MLDPPKKIAVLPFEKRTVFGPSGNGDLGFVTAEMAVAINCNSGPIRLLNGLEGRAGGFGRIHIEAHPARMKQFLGLGHKDAFGYVRFVAEGFDRIAQQADGRLVFLREQTGVHHRIICQWDPDLKIWSVTTALPKVGVSGLTFVWPVVTTVVGEEAV